MNSAQLDRIAQQFAAALLPREPEPLSRWAEEHYRLSSESSARAGLWITHPFQREPLDCLGPDSEHREVVLMWASQLGKTQLMLIRIAHAIAENPAPALLVEPDLKMADSISKDRLSPMFRDLAILKGKVAEHRARDAGSTILHRRFTGGSITLVGSNSPAGLAFRSVRDVYLDELDRFEASAGNEGDQEYLARARTRTFNHNRLIVKVSSPTTRGASRIERAFLESDQREYFVPCPLCDVLQVLEWRRVEWPDGQPDAAAYRCRGCEKLIPHHLKARMVAGGKWIAGNPDSRIAGFRLSELYSPWRTWAELAHDWLRAQGSPEKLRAFINTSLAELWDDAAAAEVSESELMARRESYGPILPERAALLTAGVDIQADRAEVSVFSFGAGEESWLMEHRIIPGDPSTPGLWAALDAYLGQQWTHPIAGAMPIHAACVDSGAFTGAVTRFCDERRGRRIYAIKGASGPRPVWPKRASKAARGTVWLVGVDSLRQTISARMRITDGPGRIHFPATSTAEYFEQLNSEYLQTAYRRGRPVREWVRRKGRRAEAWDCAVYALGALYALASLGVHADVEAGKLEAMRQVGGPTPTGYRVYRSKFMTSGRG